MLHGSLVINPFPLFWTSEFEFLEIIKVHKVLPVLSKQQGTLPGLLRTFRQPQLGRGPCFHLPEDTDGGGAILVA